MISAYVEPELLEALRPHLPAAAVVHCDWQSFLASLGKADVAVVAVARPGEGVAAEEIEAVAERRFLPLVLVLEPRGPSLQLLARVRCHACMGVDEVEHRLEGVVGAVLDEDPRSRAARAILSETKPGALVAGIVQSVLEDPVPPRSVAELAKRLNQPPRSLERQWRRDLGACTGVPLLHFIRRGSAIWAALALDRGSVRSIDQVAYKLGVASSTIYRDLAAAGLQPGHLGPDARRKAVRELLADLGVGDGRTWQGRGHG